MSVSGRLVGCVLSFTVCARVAGQVCAARVSVSTHQHIIYSVLCSTTARVKREGGVWREKERGRQVTGEIRRGNYCAQTNKIDVNVNLTT